MNNTSFNYSVNESTQIDEYNLIIFLIFFFISILCFICCGYFHDIRHENDTYRYI